MKKHEILEKLATIERALEALSVQEKKVFNTKEACSYLSVTQNALYHMTNRKQIPHAKHGRLLRFVRAELDKWLLSKQVKTIEQVEAAADRYLDNRALKGKGRQT